MNERPSRLSQELYANVTKAAAAAAILLAMASPAEASASSADSESHGSVIAGLTPFASGGLENAGNMLEGSNNDSLSGDMKTGPYQTDQYSQIALTANQPANGEWIGPAVRIGNGGQTLYVGLYDVNGSKADLQLFKRMEGKWTPLSGPDYISKLAAGTVLKLDAVGSTLAFSENGSEKLTADDSSIPVGAPGIEAYGTAAADNWSSGGVELQVDYLGTESQAGANIKTYDVISDDDNFGAQKLRVLEPTNPKPGVPHNFLYVLPVEAGVEDTEFGNGLNTMAVLNAENQYNLTIIEPAFAVAPWYANNPNNSGEQQVTFIMKQLVPWVTANFATTHHEQNWLIGFSKSGIGGMDLLLTHPGTFAEGAMWDFPADMSNINQYAGSNFSYGTNANFNANYELSPSFLNTHRAPFENRNRIRIWLGGYSKFYKDITDIGNLLTTEGIKYTAETPTQRAHRWDSGWVPDALAALEQDSQVL